MRIHVRCQNCGGDLLLQEAHRDADAVTIRVEVCPNCAGSIREKSRRAGYEEGYNNGYDTGWEYGEERGYYNAHECPNAVMAPGCSQYLAISCHLTPKPASDYDEGYDAGYAEGTADGAADGRLRGQTDTFLARVFGTTPEMVHEAQQEIAADQRIPMSAYSLDALLNSPREAQQEIDRGQTRLECR